MSRIRRIVRTTREAMQQVENAFTPIASFKPHQVLRFDWFGDPDFSRMWAAPIQSFGAWKMGPRIDVYRRADAPAAPEGTAVGQATGSRN